MSSLLIKHFRVKSPRYSNPVFTCLMILLGLLVIVAFSMHPITDGDLSRYYAWSLDYAKQPPSLLFANTEYDQKFIIMLFWVAGKTGLLALIPTMSILTVYAIAFWIICDSAKTLNIKNSILVQYVILAVALLQFDAIASNVRNVMAFAIVTLAAYRDLFKKKRNAITLLLYLLPCGLHLTAVVFILVRISLPLYKRFRLLSIATILSAPLIISKLFLVRFLFVKIPFLYALIDKAYRYFFIFYDTEWIEKVKNSGFESSKKLIFFLIFIVLLSLSVTTYHKVQKWNQEYMDLFAYTEISILLTLVSMYIPVPTYFRFSIVTLMLFSIIFFYVIQHTHKKGGMILLIYAGYINITIYGFLAQVYHFYFNFRF